MGQTKVEDNKLWKDANTVAEHIYGILADFPDEEKWAMVVKLRHAASDLIQNVTLGLSSSGPVNSEFDFVSARKNAEALRTMYRFAGRQHFITIDPEIMVLIDALRTAIEAEIQQAHTRQETYRAQEIEKDLQPWLKKYDIWKQINEGKQ